MRQSRKRAIQPRSPSSRQRRWCAACLAARRNPIATAAALRPAQSISSRLKVTKHKRRQSLNGSESGGGLTSPPSSLPLPDPRFQRIKLSGEKKGRTMNPVIQLKSRTLVFLVALTCFALSPGSKAVNPAPDGGYPGGNTAEGSDALLSLSSGTNNTAIGADALANNVSGNDNTAVGFQALLLATGNHNTAVGSEALFFDTSGHDNTPVGFKALLNNTTGILNTAIGAFSLSAH